MTLTELREAHDQLMETMRVLIDQGIVVSDGIRRLESRAAKKADTGPGSTPAGFDPVEHARSDDE